MRKYSLAMEVRDSELDAQGIVNNANYMVYLSHARHKHIHTLGLDFVNYAENNQKLVILSCTMKFKNSLVANDTFIVTSNLSSAEYPNQWVYNQDIKRESDGKIILKAIFNSTCINGNAQSEEEKLYIPEIINSLIS